MSEAQFKELLFDLEIQLMNVVLELSETHGNDEVLVEKLNDSLSLLKKIKSYSS